MNKKEIFALTIFVLSLFLVFTIIFSQVQTEIIIEIDEEERIVQQIPSNYSLLSVILIIFLSVISSLSGVYFLSDISKSYALNSRQKVQLQLLEKEEKEIYLFIIQEETVLQKDIVLELNISKVKVTRILDKLERKNLIQRLSYGNTNKIQVKN